MEEEFFLIKLLITSFIIGILICLNAFFVKSKSITLILATIFTMINMFIAFITNPLEVLKMEKEWRHENKE